MEFETVVRRRRMVRNFSDEPVAQATVARLLAVAGLRAFCSPGIVAPALRGGVRQAERSLLPSLIFLVAQLAPAPHGPRAKARLHRGDGGP